MNNNDHTARHDDLKKINDLTRDIKIAMFTSADSNGHLHARPMATQRTEFDGTVWFYTWRSTEKVDEFQHEPQVNVAYSDTGKQSYVSLSGTARLVTDQAKLRELWHPDLKAWFPKGLDDPQLALIRVDVHSAEYWDAPSGKMVALYGMAKAALAGKSVSNAGENKTLKL